mmetsp:Transcript_1228/g.3108  ORF Transcript_1228/g.3108 Transcript_1228/m.3108 type:complete len:620 (-) Transcript_1228:1523-3382(-)
MLAEGARGVARRLGRRHRLRGPAQACRPTRLRRVGLLGVLLAVLLGVARRRRVPSPLLLRALFLDLPQCLAVDGTQRDHLLILPIEESKQPPLVATVLALVAQLQELLLVQLVAAVDISLVEGVGDGAVTLHHALPQLPEVAAEARVKQVQGERRATLHVDRLPDHLDVTLEAVLVEHLLELVLGDATVALGVQDVAPGAHQRAVLFDQMLLERREHPLACRRVAFVGTLLRLVLLRGALLVAAALRSLLLVLLVPACLGKVLRLLGQVLVDPIEPDLAGLVSVQVGQQPGLHRRELDGVHQVPEVVDGDLTGAIGVIVLEGLQQRILGTAIAPVAGQAHQVDRLGDAAVQVLVPQQLPLGHQLVKELRILVDLRVLGVLTQHIDAHQAFDPLVGRQPTEVVRVQPLAPALGDAVVARLHDAEEVFLRLARLLQGGLAVAHVLYQLVLHRPHLLHGRHADRRQLVAPNLFLLLLVLSDQRRDGLLLFLLFVEEAEDLGVQEAFALGIEMLHEAARVFRVAHLLADLPERLRGHLDALLLVPAGHGCLHGRNHAAKLGAAAGLEQLALLHGLWSNVPQSHGAGRLQLQLLPQPRLAALEAGSGAADQELVLLQLALTLQI